MIRAEINLIQYLANNNRHVVCSAKHELDLLTIALPISLFGYGIEIMLGIDITSFAESQLTLLSAELAAETSSTSALLSSTSPTTLARAGFAITNLTVSSQRTGLGGKTVLELEQDHAIGNNGEIGEHGIRVGDIVRVGEQPRGGERKKEKVGMETRGSEGVVIRVGNKGVQVALGDGDKEGNVVSGRLWV